MRRKEKKIEKPKIKRDPTFGPRNESHDHQRLIDERPLSFYLLISILKNKKTKTCHYQQLRKGGAESNQPTNKQTKGFQKKEKAKRKRKWPPPPFWRPPTANWKIMAAFSTSLTIEKRVEIREYPRKTTEKSKEIFFNKNIKKTVKPEEIH